MLTNKKIDEYIIFFKDTQNFYNIIDGYIRYHNTVDQFIKDCYSSNMMDTEYLSKLDGHIKNGIEPKELIYTSDIEMLKVILTFYIRGDRFNEGMIANAIDKKIFLDILKKLNNI